MDPSRSWSGSPARERERGRTHQDVGKAAVTGIKGTGTGYSAEIPGHLILCFLKIHLMNHIQTLYTGKILP